MVEITATEVDRFYPFLVVPDTLIGVWLWREAGQARQRDPFGGTVRQDILDP